MNLKKCPKCKSYTLKDTCKKCSATTNDAHYKFVRIKTSKDNDKY